MGLNLAEVMGNQTETSAGGNEGSEPSPETEALTTQPEEGLATEESEGQDALAAEASESDGSDDAQDADNGKKAGPIPYDRFKQKVSQVNDLKEMLELQKQRIEMLEGAHQGQSGRGGEEPQPEEVDPLVARLEGLDDEYGSSEEMVGIMKDMASELKTLRSQAATSSEGVHQIRVKERVKSIEAQVAREAEAVGVYDPAGARTFVFESLSRDTTGDITELIKKFSDWEKQQEEGVLKRLGISRKEQKAQVEEPQSVPPSRSQSSSGGKQAHGQKKQKTDERPMTLRDMRRSFTRNRR